MDFTKETQGEQASGSEPGPEQTVETRRGNGLPDTTPEPGPHMPAGADTGRAVGTGPSSLPKIRKRRRKLPVFLSQDEADRLVAAAASERDRVIFLCLLYLGLRVAELCALRLERIDLGRGQVLVYQGKGGKDRMLPINSNLLQAVRIWIGTRTEGWLFPSPRKSGRPLTTRCVQLLVSKAAQVAGIKRPDPTQRISPHKLRHTMATRLVEKGVDIVTVKEILGHSSIAVTSIYVHSSAERLRGAVDRL